MSHLLSDHPDWPNAMTTPTPRSDAVREETRGLSGLAKAIRFADLADALERDLAAAKSENAKLKAHAEAMHDDIEKLRRQLARVCGGESFRSIPADAYRRDFPKDAP